MRSRIVAITLSVLLFFSALYIVGFPEKEITVNNTTSVSSEAETEATTEKEVETVICSFKDISYGSDQKQTIDLDLPVDNRKETGLVLFLHGGGWVSGDKTSTGNAYRINMPNKHFATATINYRLAELGKADIYDIINDITAALSHIKEFAAGYGININKLVLCGYSAGGHLALLYAYKYKHLSPIELVGVFANSPAVDLSLDKFYEENSMGDEDFMCELMSNACGVEFTKTTREEHADLLKELSPINYISADSVPTVIAHGRLDTVVPIEASELFIKTLSENSVSSDLIIFEKSSHNLNNDLETKAYADEVISKYVTKWLELDKNN